MEEKTDPQTNTSLCLQTEKIPGYTIPRARIIHTVPMAVLIEMEGQVYEVGGAIYKTILSRKLMDEQNRAFRDGGAFHASRVELNADETEII